MEAHDSITPVSWSLFGGSFSPPHEAQLRESPSIIELSRGAVTLHVRTDYGIAEGVAPLGQGRCRAAIGELVYAMQGPHQNLGFALIRLDHDVNLPVHVHANHDAYVSEEVPEQPTAESLFAA